VHQDHPEQREPAEDIERLQATVGIDRRQRRRRRCKRSSRW